MGDINRDPSMEEILASIKRVISEETPPAPPPRARAPKAVEEDEILELSEPAESGESLISEDAASASRNKLAELAGLRRQEEIPTISADGSLEAVVREMLKPMLKQWLDQRLPEIVDEMVAREIARITSGKGI